MLGPVIITLWNEDQNWVIYLMHFYMLAEKADGGSGKEKFRTEE
jgi:hypothetical protein